MNTLRRITTAITANFDWMISQVENHDALVTTAIRDVQEAGARAKTQLARVKSDGRNLRIKLTQLHAEQDLWAERAIKVSELDQTKALECLKRKKKLADEIARLEVSEREHTRLEKQLGEDLVLIENRLDQLKNQRSILRARQNRAEALRTMHGEESTLLGEIDDIFDRWETKVAQYEFQAQNIETETDTLEEEFATEEQQAALLAELNELKNQQPQGPADRPETD